MQGTYVLDLNINAIQYILFSQIHTTENNFFKNSCGTCTRPQGKMKLFHSLNQNVVHSLELWICHGGAGWWLFFFSPPLCFSAEVPPRGFRYHCQTASEYQQRKSGMQGCSVWDLAYLIYIYLFCTSPSGRFFPGFSFWELHLKFWQKRGDRTACCSHFASFLYPQMAELLTALFPLCS